MNGASAPIIKSQALSKWPWGSGSKRSSRVRVGVVSLHGLPAVRHLPHQAQQLAVGIWDPATRTATTAGRKAWLAPEQLV